MVIPLMAIPLLVVVIPLDGDGWLVVVIPFLVFFFDCVAFFLFFL